MAIPRRSAYIVIGAGIHGRSTAYHLALQLKATSNDFDYSTGIIKTSM